MKIVCDKHIPFFVEAVQQAWPEVTICPMDSEQINADTLHDADVLVVRTRTKVNAELLENTCVRLVCTATIGYDHIDTAYCKEHDVHWTTCPGCNAQAVCDYIEEALNHLPITNLQTPLNPTIGVIGVGHVGSLVAQMAERKGLHVLLNDPPKGIGVSLEEIAEKCDIITFHVPLDATTFHLCDASFLAKCKPTTLIINAARGGVVDEKALLQSSLPFILDTWENEPRINPEVVQQALLASMHIAGYSMEGKRKATQMCLDEIARIYQLPFIHLQPCKDAKGDSQPGWLARITMHLKAHPEQFEALRSQYLLR